MTAWRLCQKMRIDYNLMGRDKNICIDLCLGTIYVYISCIIMPVLRIYRQE